MSGMVTVLTLKLLIRLIFYRLIYLFSQFKWFIDDCFIFLIVY